jgi:hypothetical protein
MALALLPLLLALPAVLPLRELLHAAMLVASVALSARQANAVVDRFICPP